MQTGTVTNQDFQFRFSICCIVTNMSQYEAMRTSFEKNGFTDACEYLVADNSKGNAFDAYSAINYFLQNSTAEIAIITHQDVRCIDNRSVLEEQLDLLNQKDQRWAVCGNAGGVAYHQLIYHLNDNGTIRKTAGLPRRVHSLDENLLIVNRRTPVHASENLKGFHLYGTDICLRAESLGYHAYVIPFMVQHLSSGNLRDLDQFIPVFLEQYGNQQVNRFIQTTCTGFYLSDSPGKNKFYNSPGMIQLIKFYQRLKNLF